MAGCFLTTKDPRILVYTLFSGENEFKMSVDSLISQSYVNWDQQVYRNLPNKIAHDTIYSEFMRRAGDYDLFIKLDADMVFTDTFALEKIIELFNANPGLDHLQIALRDWFTGTLIGGLHIYSNRCAWNFNDERLFVDYKPEIPGNRLVLFSEPAPLAAHSPNPSPYQAFHFGVHRALKAFQPERHFINTLQAGVQWEVLKKTWERFKLTRDRRLGLLVYGANMVADGRLIKPIDEYRDQEILEAYRECSQLSSDQLYRRLWRWKNPVTRELLHKTRIGKRYASAKLNAWAKNLEIGLSRIGFDSEIKKLDKK